MNAWRSGGGVPRARRQGRGGLSWKSNSGWRWWRPLLAPSLRPMIPYHWPANPTELPAPVAIATSAHERWDNSYGIKYSPSHRRQSVCLLLLYILLPATSPPACTSCHDLLKCTSALCWYCLIKTPAWNKWCNCLHGQKCVYSLAGSLALSPRVAVFVLMYVSPQECTEEFSCHIK